MKLFEQSDRPPVEPAGTLVLDAIQTRNEARERPSPRRWRDASPLAHRLALAVLARAVRVLDQSLVSGSPVFEGEKVDPMMLGALHASSLTDLGR